ncbi:TBC domain-containing protein kinase-like protein [Manis javanica]|nr:TBC domain-containing protein kinase-like protein [Manis javanica]
MASNYNAAGQYALVGNPNLKEESSNAFDFGLKGSPTPGVTFNSSVFYTRYSDFIAYTRYLRAGRPDLFVTCARPHRHHLPGRAGQRKDLLWLRASARLDHGQWMPAARGLVLTWALGISRGTSKSYYAGDKDVPLDSVLPRKAIVGVGYDAPARHA